MRFAPTEDQLEFAAAVRALLQDTCGVDALRPGVVGGEVGAHTGSPTARDTATAGSARPGTPSPRWGCSASPCPRPMAAWA